MVKTESNSLKTWVEVFVYLVSLSGSFDLLILSKGKGVIIYSTCHL